MGKKINLTGEHNHLPDLEHIECLKHVDCVKLKATLTNDQPRLIILSSQLTISDAAGANPNTREEIEIKEELKDI